MLNLDELEVEREKATIDKADLFDFYNSFWDQLVGEIEDLRKPKERERQLVANTRAEMLKEISVYLSGFERGIDPSIIAELEETFGQK